MSKQAIRIGNYIIPTREIEYIDSYGKYQIYIILKSKKELIVNVDEKDFEEKFNKILEEIE